MRTEFVTPEKYARAVLDIAGTMDVTGSVRPERFRKTMRENIGSIDLFNPFGPADDGLERKNPVVAALGDSVTAGHFEFIGNPAVQFAKAHKGAIREGESVEIVDARECYLEKFRAKLIDKYELTSVSTLNAGIAGDTIYGMQKRVYRDVIRYQPDLAIINGSLNWGADCGSTQDYRKVLTEVVKVIRKETKADIVLLTPNMDHLPPLMAPKPGESTLDERVQVIREIAEEEKVCLADVYKVWKAYVAAGYPLDALLANGMNHPSVTGHELYARVLMRLLE